MFLNFSDGLSHWSRKAQSAILLEMLRVPYVGTDPLGLLTAGNKHYTKNCLHNINCVNIANSVLCYSMQDMNNNNLNAPVILKPNREGSSIGISQLNFCQSHEQIHVMLAKLLITFTEVLIEEYIAGYEVTQFLIGNPTHFPVNEVIVSSYNGKYYFENFVFGLEEKSNHKRRQESADAILNNGTIRKIKQAGEKIFQSINMRDFARIDYRVQLDGTIFFLEINGNPVMSDTSEVGLICRKHGCKIGDIIGLLIQTAEARLSSHG